MANTITDLKDVRISQNALLPWMETLLPLSAFSTNFSPDAADKLDTVKVPVIGAPSASSDYAGDYTANADSEASSVAVTLDRHKCKRTGENSVVCRDAQVIIELSKDFSYRTTKSVPPLNPHSTPPIPASTSPATTHPPHQRRKETPQKQEKSHPAYGTGTPPPSVRIQYRRTC